ncbi:hypothetical protein NIES2100_72200 [Calothrix sp. NIES-2100]|uniref:SUMF1/EgtB/PvdO family nonheme iron enzyme n=1 Tax=Calothrix sp. NIES-2100 TaxID=1954172 RepID=UPI000B5F739F|nr:hypothetical protein NIES2100_72200 [Calothrix sp. NIES-2100]
MAISGNLTNKLVSLLQRHLRDKNECKSKLFLLFGVNSSISNQINWDTALSNIIPDLIDRLDAYGTMPNSENIALCEFLKLISESVGADVQIEISKLSQLIIQEKQADINTRQQQNFASKLSVFNFETAKLYVKNQSVISYKESKQANYFVEDLPYGVKLEMVEIPGGTFWMGASNKEQDSSDSERPIHEVTVPTFFMGKYTITQEQWEKVAGFLPKINRYLEPKPSRFKGHDRLPVESISWYDAVEFCDRLSQYTRNSYRLPSEAEWEYACRAGTTTPFHFGETITSELANYNATKTYGAGVKGTYRKETTEVGSFKVANAFGLYDMHGNLWEWCLDDWHSNYEGAPTDSSAWFNDNNNLSQKQGIALLRGGSWIVVPNGCRSASRLYLYWAVRDYVFSFVGFRVVCAAGNIF